MQNYLYIRAFICENLTKIWEKKCAQGGIASGRAGQWSNFDGRSGKFRSVCFEPWIIKSILWLHLGRSFHSFNREYTLYGWTLSRSDVFPLLVITFQWGQNPQVITGETWNWSGGNNLAERVKACSKGWVPAAVIAAAAAAAVAVNRARLFPSFPLWHKTAVHAYLTST